MRPVVKPDVRLFLLAASAIAGLVVPNVVARKDAKLGKGLERGFDVPAVLLVPPGGLGTVTVQFPLGMKRLDGERALAHHSVDLGQRCTYSRDAHGTLGDV